MLAKTGSSASHLEGRAIQSLPHSGSASPANLAAAGSAIKILGSMDVPKPKNQDISPDLTGLSPKERRLAPRSSNQFRVGPPFSDTKPGRPILNSSKEPVAPRISARLDRGFDMIEGEWIGYKRNYFTLVAAFSFWGLPLGVTATDTFQYVDESGAHRNIHAFKISLTSVCLEDKFTAVTLVQHTAKRDRGPQSSPPQYYAVPGELPAHSTMKQVANIRNGEKIDKCNRLFYLSKDDHQNAIFENPNCVLATYPVDCEISLVARYERIQFSSAGCGNRKSASTNNKHYILVVDLLGVTDSGSDVVLASTHSPPLIVRGRSPSNYPLSEKGDNKQERAVSKLASSSIPFRDDSDPENDSENQTKQKKRKVKQSAKTSRSPLGKNANFLNVPGIGFVIPEIERPDKRKALFGSFYGKLPADKTERAPRAVRTQQSQHYHEYNYAHIEANQNDLYIQQEESFPMVTDLPQSQSPLQLDSENEPLNVNRTEFQSSNQFLHSQMSEYEQELLELELEDYPNAEIMTSYDRYSQLPTPIVFPDTMRTSTPLQLPSLQSPAAMRPDILRNLHPSARRCKHGFKLRESSTTENRQSERVYTYADLSDSGMSDTSFVMFKQRLASFRPLIRDKTPGAASPRSSPLTILSSEQLYEAQYLQEVDDVPEDERD